MVRRNNTNRRGLLAVCTTRLSRVFVGAQLEVVDKVMDEPEDERRRLSSRKRCVSGAIG